MMRRFLCKIEKYLVFALMLIFVSTLVGLSGVSLLQVVQAEENVSKSPDEAHEDIFLENRFPSAATCKTCHPVQYRQWSVSQHSYSQLSPLYNTMQAAIIAVTSGTQGDFCIRCHNPVGMILEEPFFTKNEARHPTSREGITCVVCHRLNREYGKLSGRLSIVEGDLFSPVFGPNGNDELKRVIESDDYRVATERGKSGRGIHTDAKKFFQLNKSGFCGLCHDVNFVNGFRLEEAFSSYKTSPAAEEGVSCQDCHMGVTPGVFSGDEKTNYHFGPVAKVGGVETRPRKLTNHFFAGPDISSIHPGIFPHNPKAAEMATISEWLTFDYKAGWGTDAFEVNLPEGHVFPKKWDSIDDRYDARDILNDQQKLLDEATVERTQILKHAYQLGKTIIERADEGGVRFKVLVRNGTNGHSVPIGFNAERTLFLQVTVTDSQGNTIFKSGDLDPNGDIRDSHSLYVHNGEVPLDTQLFTLQSEFLTRNLRGGEREQVLPLNFSIDPLLFVRPSTFSTILTGAPRGARLHRTSIEPNGYRWAKYKIKGSELTGKGSYRVNIKLIAGMLPGNLLHSVSILGFDFGLSLRDMANKAIESRLVLWERDEVIEVNK